MKWNRQFLRKSVVLLTAVLTVSSLPGYRDVSYAAEIPHMDAIRVALFIDSAKYSHVEPVITLSAAGGVELGIRSGGSTKTWLSLPGAAQIRSSLDQYSVKMLETASYASANALYSKLATMAGDSYVLTRVKQGKTVYQVYYGSYATYEAAEGAKLQAAQDAAVAALLQGSTPVLTGPLHLRAGSYSTEAEARNQAGVFEQAGLDASVAYQENAGGTLAYNVWVGSAANADQLNAVKQQAQTAVPTAELQPADTGKAYILYNLDVTGSASGTDGIPHFAIGGGEQKVLIHPIQAGITVKERASRSYRGDIEISGYHGKLAVINELPLEQYLYSVVSSELGQGWPAEALKAQAVAARTYALKQGTKYEIANVTDTTNDQAYNGIQQEFEAAVQAVDATAGEVLTDQNGLIEPVFSSNAGGTTADPSEVWGNPVPYLRSVPSPDDGAAAGKMVWYRVQLSNGKTGFVRSDYLQDTGEKSSAGVPYYAPTDSAVNVRSAPYVDNTANPPIGQLDLHEKVLMIGQETESNAYSWTRGPYDAAYLESKLKAAGVQLDGGLRTLEVSKRGPSGRVTELKANGQVVNVPYPDALRTVLGGLPSTRFEIEQAGSYTGSTASAAVTGENSGIVIAGAEGTSQSGNAGEGSVYVLAGGQSAPVSQNVSDLTVIGAAGQAQKAATATSDQTAAAQGQGGPFLFKGTGFGHGLGMSQWGARGYAELGYDYKKILQTYYYGVNITKE